MNSTYTKPDSYDMTPSRDELPPKPPASQDNYGIDDLKSDEVTNSELISPSKKKILSEISPKLKFDIFDCF